MEEKKQSAVKHGGERRGRKTSRSPGERQREVIQRERDV